MQLASLSAKAQDVLQAELEVPMASLEDIYGGKLVAALDRQHPRDLFDVMQLYANEGITPAIRRAFVVYIASHNRPPHEVLSPILRDITQDYERTFVGMTTEPVEHRPRVFCDPRSSAVERRSQHAQSSRSSRLLARP